MSKHKLGKERRRGQVHGRPRSITRGGHSFTQTQKDKNKKKKKWSALTKSKMECRVGWVRYGTHPSGGSMLCVCLLRHGVIVHVCYVCVHAHMWCRDGIQFAMMPTAAAALISYFHLVQSDLLASMPMDYDDSGKSSPIPADLQGATSHDIHSSKCIRAIWLSHKEIERDRLIIIIL